MVEKPSGPSIKTIGPTSTRFRGLAKFSLMFGLVQFAASLFSAFNQNLLHWALSVIPWRELFNYVGAAGLVLLLAAVLKLRDPSPVKLVPGQSFGKFLSSVFQSLLRVASIPHVWVAAAFGALIFGVMLALGVVWAPKLLMVRGWDVATANTASSFLWLGLAVLMFSNMLTRIRRSSRCRLSNPKQTVEGPPFDNGLGNRMG